MKKESGFLEALLEQGDLYCPKERWTKHKGTCNVLYNINEDAEQNEKYMLQS